MNPHDDKSHWMVFLLSWVVATTLGWSLGLRLSELNVEFQNEILELVLSNSLIFSPIFLAGLGQWGVMYWRFKTPSGWLGAALSSSLLLIVISPLIFALVERIIPPGLFSNDPYMYEPIPSAHMLIIGSLVFFSIIGAAIAIPQWLVLRRSIKNAGSWILISILAWLVSYPLFQISKIPGLEISMEQITREVIWGFVLGLIPGIILVLKFRKTELTPPSARLLFLDRVGGILTILVVIFIPIIVFFTQ